VGFIKKVLPVKSNLNQEKAEKTRNAEKNVILQKIFDNFVQLIFQAMYHKFSAANMRLF